MASTLQHGVNRHCLSKAYLWHVCKGPLRRSMVGSSTAHLWRAKNTPANFQGSMLECQQDENRRWFDSTEST